MKRTSTSENFATSLGCKRKIIEYLFAFSWRKPRHVQMFVVPVRPFDVASFDGLGRG